MARKDSVDRGIICRCKKHRKLIIPRETPNGDGSTKMLCPEGCTERDGVWSVRYFHRGTEHQEVVGSKSAARAAYESRKTDIRQEKFDPKAAARQRPKLLLKTAVKAYLEESRAVKRSWQEDERHGRIWEAEFADTPLVDIQPADIERWKRQRMAAPGPGKRKHLAPATVNRSLAFLKHLFALAVRDGHVQANPVARVNLLTENNVRTRFLRDDEEAALRQDMAPDDFAIIEIAYKTGMRESEQFTLQRPQVDLRNRIITIPRSKHGEKRHIDIGDDVAVLLQRFLNQTSGKYVFPVAMLAPDMTAEGDPQIVQERAGQNWVRRCFNKA